MKIHDLFVIGARPTGYTAAIYAARAGSRSVVCESSISRSGCAAALDAKRWLSALPELAESR